MRNRIALIAPALAAAVGLSLFAAACGGSGGKGVAQIGSTQATTAGSSSNSGSPSDRRGILVAFSACMRKHGVPDFPDPKTSGTGKVTSTLPDSPQAKAAQKACRHLLPNGGSPDTSEQAKERTFLLKYAACMRRHGISKFPDPNSQGRFPEHPAGFDPRAPSFEAARKACQPLAGGFVNTRP